jgi:hypothetical protein
MELPYDCPKCFDHLLTEPFLSEALASVAMSRGISTAAMAQRYFGHFHASKHPSARERMTDPETVKQIRERWDKEDQ